ncbi:c-type cytochrome [Variovorax sp. 2RAF20]
MSLADHISSKRNRPHDKGVLLALALALFIAPVSPAIANQALATSKACIACHSATQKLVGPSFQDIAGRYKNVPGALDSLAGKMIKGSAGVWGPMPMPPNPQLSAEDANKLARWILGAG